MKKIILSYLMAISMFSPNLSNANMLNSSHYSATYLPMELIITTKENIIMQLKNSAI